MAPRIATAADDTIWLAWLESSGGGDSMTSARIDRAGHITMTTISTSESKSAYDPQIAMTGTTPIVAWWEVAGDARRIRVTVWNGSGWTIEQTVEVASPLVGMQLLAAGNGEVCVVWLETFGVRSPGNSR